jgi:glycosyltransferase involved in cell wall biosynthesis
MVSTYPPRHCGSATYAAELGRALAPEFEPVVCAVDRYGQTYPDEVVAVVREDDPDDYRRAARVLAEHGADVVLLHYDDSAPFAADLAAELRRLGLPYVVAVHRPPAGPDKALTSAQQVLVFTAADGAALPGVDPDRIEIVPLGVPTALWHSRHPGGRRRARNVSPPRPAVAALLDRLAPGPVLASVGAFGPERDLDTTLLALGSLRSTGAQLVIAGRGDATGSAWLRARIAALGLTDSVHLLDLWLNPVELAALLGRTDIVLAPAIPGGRAWSATLTAAVTAGCAVVARHHPYAEELLAGGVGMTVDAGDPDALAQAVRAYLDQPSRLADARSAAMTKGRRLTWPAVVNRYAAVLRRAARPTPPGQARVLRLDRVVIPAPDQLEQWSRLAAVSAHLVALPPEHLPPRSWRRALSWLDTAVTALAVGAADAATGRGWALCGLGAVAAEPAVPLPLRERAQHLRAMVAALPVPDLTGAALAVLGLTTEESLDDAGAGALNQAAQQLRTAWRDGTGRAALWPGLDVGARLPQAMIRAGRRLDDPELLRRGIEGLDWYARRSGLIHGELHVPGPDARAAAQVGALVEALVDAYVIAGGARHARLALAAFAWFDPARGTASTDATLAYLGALLSLARADLARLALARNLAAA